MQCKTELQRRPEAATLHGCLLSRLLAWCWINGAAAIF